MFFRVKGHPNQLLNIQFSFCTARLRLEKGKTLAFICYPTEEHIQSFFFLLFLRAWRLLSFTSHSLPVRISDVFTLQNPLIHTQNPFQPYLKIWLFCDNHNNVPGSMHSQLLSVCIHISPIWHSHILFSSAHHLKTDFSDLLNSALAGTPPGISCHQLAELWASVAFDPRITAYPPTLLLLLLLLHWTWLLMSKNRAMMTHKCTEPLESCG